MKKITLGYLLSLSLALPAGNAAADSVGPYYATPSWDQTLPAATRFVLLSNFQDQAFLDRNTGLVWNTSPYATSSSVQGIAFVCHIGAIGGQYGWRLPTLPELQTLFSGQVTIGDEITATFDVPPALVPTLSTGSSIYTHTQVDGSTPTSYYALYMFAPNQAIVNFGPQLTSVNPTYQFCVRSAH